KAHPLHRHLASALDSWLNARLNVWSYEQQRDAEWWKRLLRVASRADSDPVRNRVRAVILDSREQPLLTNRDSQRRWGRIDRDSKALNELAGSADVGRLPVPTVILLARSLFWKGEPETGLRGLKQAPAHQPDHFGLTMDIG